MAAGIWAFGSIDGAGVALGPHQPGVTYKAVMWGSAVSRLMLHTHRTIHNYLSIIIFKIHFAILSVLNLGMLMHVIFYLQRMRGVKLKVRVRSQTE